MSKAKRNGFTILLAAALSFIFAAFLCLGFPMAEVRAEEKTVTGAAEFLVAMAYGESGDTVKLGAGITVDLTDEDFVGEVYPGNPDPNKDLVLKAEEGTSLDLTVDLNGNTLEIITGSDKSCLTLIGEVALKVVDTSADGDGKVIGHSNGNLFYGDANSALTLESVDVEFTAADNITVAKPAIYTEGSVSLSDVNYASSNAAEASLIGTESLADGTYVYSDGSNYYVGGEEILAQTGVVAAIEQTNEAYTSLQEAIDEASAGSTVTLIADAVCEDDGLIQSNGGCFISVPADKDITLDLNGKAIKVIPQESSGAYRDYTVLYNTGTLTIADSSSEKTGTMLVDDKSVSRIILNIIANAGTLNIEGGNYNGQCPFANGGTLNIYSGNFFNTRDASETIAIACAEGTINILKNDKGLPEPVFTNVAFTYANEIETSAVINIECGTIIGADAQQIDPDLTMDKVFLAFYYGDYANQNLQFNVTGGTFEGGIVLGDNLSSAPESEDIQFSGGTFSEPVPAEYLAEGFTLAADGDGFSVLTEETVADYMAYITGEDGTAIYYETLQEAVEAAVAGDTIVLAKDIEATGSVINTTLDAQITIDLNGHTIKSSNQNTAVFTIRTTKNLTITSSQEGGAIEAAYALLLRPKESGITITVENIAFSGRISFYSPIQITRLSTAEAKAVLSNVTVDYDHAAGSARTAAIYVSDIAELEINDSTIEVTDAATNRDTEFYAVELNATTAEFYGGSIAAEGDLSRAIHSHNRGQTPSVVTLNGTTVSGQDRAIYSYYSTLTLNGAAVSAVNNAAVHGEGSGITIDGGSISSEKGPGIVFLGGIVLEEAADLLAADNTASFKTLELGGGVTVTGYTFAVSGNGSAKENQPYSGTIINVRDASLTGNIGHGVYQPQVGILNVYDGAVISGASGIEIRAGELYVSGGTITGTRSELVISDAAAGGGGGTSIDGAAIAISQHSTNKPVFVSITGGNLTGPAALYEEDVLNETANDTINASVTGGTFTSTPEGMASVFSENMEGFVSGGIFGEALPAEYLAEDCAQIASGETFTVGTEENLAAAQNAVAVNEETGIAYTNLQEAINNASDGSTIKLLQSITVDTAAANHPEGRTDVGLYILQKNLTINGNGKTIQSSSVPRILNVIGDYNADGTADCDLFTVTIENLTIVSTGVSHRPLETRGGNITLNLENVMLDNTGTTVANSIAFSVGGNSTCGSSALPVNVNISGSTLTAMATGYAFKSFNPVTLNITDESVLTGYAALWFDGQHSSFGSRGSVVTVENSTLTATNSFSGKSDFAAVVLDDSNIEVTLTDSDVNVIANGASKQATVMYGADASSLAVKGSSTVLLSGSNALHSMYRSGTVSDLSSIVYTLGAGVKTNVLTADVAENSVIYYDEAQKVYVVVGEENAAGAGVVALNGVVGYTDLAEAFAEAKDGDTITLLTDIGSEQTPATETSSIVFDKAGANVTFDLNGHSLYLTNGTVDVNNGLRFMIVRAGTVIVTNSQQNGGVISSSGIPFRIAPNQKIEAKLILEKGVKVIGQGGPAVFLTPQREAIVSDGSAYYAVLETSADLDTPTTFAAIQGNGTSHGTSITVNGGRLTSNFSAIYQPQFGKLVINDGVLEGQVSGMEIRGGFLEINGGEIIAHGEFQRIKNDNGSTLYGVAVAVSEHTTEMPITVTINDGIFTATDASGYAYYQADTEPDTNANVTVEVKGGTYNGGVHSENVAAFITGGTFSEMPLFSYFEKGYVAAWNEDAQMYVTEEGNWVASINERAYASLEDAINAAKDGDAVTLLSDITISETLTIDNAIALDLNDCTITSAADVAVRITADATLEGGTLIAADGAQAVIVDGAVVEFNEITVTGGAPEATENLYFIEITNGSDVTFNGSTVTFTYAYAESVNPDAPPQGQVIRSLASDLTIVNSTITSGDYGVTFRGSMTDEEAVAADASEYKTLTITDSTIQARLFAVSGNGSGTNHGTNIAVTGSSKLESTEAQAIYHPQYGTLNISLADDETQAYIKGTAGIEMRAGSLTVESGYIEATGEFASGPQGGGSTTDGAAIAIVQHTTQLPISVELNGGKYVGDYAVYEYNQQGNPAEAIEDISLSVTGGTYEGDLSSQNLTGFISGGQFAYQPTEDYMDPDYVAEYRGGYYVPVESSALRAAQANAQADVRAYAASLGMVWADIEEIAADSEAEDQDLAQAILDGYAAIAEATSEKGVAEARLAAMDAVDAMVQNLADYKSELIAALQSFALDDSDTAEDELDVVVPTATYLSINSAASMAEAKFYYDNAVAEIVDIRAYRTAIAEQTAQLTDLAEKLASFESNMGVEFGQLLTDIQGALEEAQAAIVGGDGSDSLASIQDYLENTIKITLDSISGTLNTVAGDVASVKTTLENLDVSAELKEEFDALAKAIADAQAAINSNTGTELDAAIEEINQATADAVAGLRAELVGEDGASGVLGELADAVGALNGLLTEGDNSLAAIVADIEAAKDAILGTASGEGVAATGLQAVLEAVNGVSSSIDEAMAGINSALESLSADVAAVQTTIDELNLSEQFAAVEQAIADAQTAINSNTTSAVNGAVTQLKDAISAAQSEIIAAIPDYTETLTDQRLCRRTGILAGRRKRACGDQGRYRQRACGARYGNGQRYAVWLAGSDSERQCGHSERGR